MVMYSVEGCIIRSVESLSLIGTSVDANTNVCLFVYMCIQINIHLYRKRINDEFLHSCLSNMYVEKKMYYCIIIHVDTQTHTIEKIIHVLFMYVSVLRRLRLCLVYTCTHVLRLCLE